jgi:hypothetical protein
MANLNKDNRALISFVLAEDDVKQFSDEHQGELKRLQGAAKVAGVGVDPRFYMQAGAGGFGGMTGDFTLAAKSVGALIPVVIAWLHGRAGRMVEVKVGDTVVRARNAKEAKNLLEYAQTFKQANEPKRIHER